VRFEPTISAGERLQTYALDRAATVTGSTYGTPIPLRLYVLVCTVRTFCHVPRSLYTVSLILLVQRSSTHCVCFLQRSVGRGSSVGTATRYGLDGLGIEYRWMRHFPHTSRPAPGLTQPPIQWVPGLSGGGEGHKAAGEWRSPPTSIWRRS